VQTPRKLLPRQFLDLLRRMQVLVVQSASTPRVKIREDPLFRNHLRKRRRRRTHPTRLLELKPLTRIRSTLVMRKESEISRDQGLA
jgi:hypothetical protein